MSNSSSRNESKNKEDYFKNKKEVDFINSIKKETYDPKSFETLVIDKINSYNFKNLY